MARTHCSLNSVQKILDVLGLVDMCHLLLKQTIGLSGNSGIPEAEIFGRKRKFSLFGLRFWPPNLKAEYGRKSNFRFFSKWIVKLETVVDILVGQIEARLNENKSKPNDSGVNLNFEKSMANIIQSRSKTQNDSIDSEVQN